MKVRTSRKKRKTVSPVNKPARDLTLWIEDTILLSPQILLFINDVKITRPELGFIVMTRAMLGAGVALLLADRLSRDQRKAVGVTLLLIGAVTTIPAVLAVFTKPERCA